MTHEVKAIASFLKHIAPLDDAVVKDFAATSRLKRFIKKEIFLREGDICDRVLFIHQGIFRYYVLHEGDDHTKDFAIEQKNPFCTAYTSLVTKKPSEIYIEALEDSLVSWWKEAQVTAFFEHDVKTALLAKTMAQQLFIRKERRELSFLRLTALERYVAFRAEFPGLEQRVSQYCIASYLGVTPETLSRIRHQLTKKS